jgi:hypothetical protein
MLGLKFSLSTHTEGPVSIIATNKQLIKYQQLIASVRQEPVTFLTETVIIRILEGDIAKDELKYDYDKTNDVITMKICVFDNYTLHFTLTKDMLSLPSVETRITLLEAQLEEMYMTDNKRRNKIELLETIICTIIYKSTNAQKIIDDIKNKHQLKIAKNHKDIMFFEQIKE